MSEILDLFGDPVPDGRGKPGRPVHVPTQENRNKVNMLLAFGWNNDRIASALHITAPTLRRHYFRELKFREEARDRLDALVGIKLLDRVREGDVSAIREFRKLLQHNDLMLFGQVGRPALPAKPGKPPKLGKKEAALADARNPDTSSTLGHLIARRQGGMN